MSLEFVSTMSLEFFVNYVLDWFTCRNGRQVLERYPTSYLEKVHPGY